MGKIVKCYNNQQDGSDLNYDSTNDNVSEKDII